MSSDFIRCLKGAFFAGLAAAPAAVLLRPLVVVAGGPGSGLEVVTLLAGSLTVALFALLVGVPVALVLGFPVLLVLERLEANRLPVAPTTGALAGSGIGFVSSWPLDA